MEHVTDPIYGVELYPCEATGSWYEVGHHGEVGTFIAAMFADGTPDLENLGEAECTYEEAVGRPAPPCEHEEVGR